jgi:hypothetical protein
MTNETMQTLSTRELTNVSGGLGWFANRFPIAAAGLRRFAFGPGANLRGARIGCPSGNCGGGASGASGE